MSGLLPDQVIGFVATELDARASEKTRAWWTRYLKGEAAFRGVKMADTRTIAAAVDKRFDLADLSIGRLFDVTDRLFLASETEDKLCAILLLGERHLERLRTGDVGRLAWPLEHGLLSDWNSCDWYCIKTLGPYIAETDTERRARAIAAWRDADGLWQRRAAAVAFANLVAGPPLFDGFHQLIVEVCRRNVADPTRWSQTSVGWVMRELSKQAPDIVSDFVSANSHHMSTEAERAATRYL